MSSDSHFDPMMESNTVSQSVTPVRSWGRSLGISRIAVRRESVLRISVSEGGGT